MQNITSQIEKHEHELDALRGQLKDKLTSKLKNKTINLEHGSTTIVKIDEVVSNDLPISGGFVKELKWSSKGYVMVTISDDNTDIEVPLEIIENPEAIEKLLSHTS